MRLLLIARSERQLKSFTDKFVEQGQHQSQLSLITYNDYVARRSTLSRIPEIFQRDVVRGALWGATIGIAITAIIVLGFVGLANVGQMGLLFWAAMSVLMIGFCSWEGCLIGIHHIASWLKPVKKSLRKGHHVIKVSGGSDTAAAVKRVMVKYPGLAIQT